MNRKTSEYYIYPETEVFMGGRMKRFLVIIALAAILLAGCAQYSNGNPQGNSTLSSASSAQTINMVVDSRGWTPNTLYLQRGVKTRWVIDARQITKCNKAIMLPNYEQHISIEGGLPQNARVNGSDLYIDLEQGENVFEFTPIAGETYKWSCWMKMINGSFVIS